MFFIPWNFILLFLLPPARHVIAAQIFFSKSIFCICIFRDSQRYSQAPLSPKSDIYTWTTDNKKNRIAQHIKAIQIEKKDHRVEIIANNQSQIHQ